MVVSLREAGQARGMQQHVPQGGAFLAAGGELRPHVGYPHVVAEVAAFGQHVRE